MKSKALFWISLVAFCLLVVHPVAAAVDNESWVTKGFFLAVSALSGLGFHAAFYPQSKGKEETS